MRAPIDNERNVKLDWYWYNIWQGENLDKQFVGVAYGTDKDAYEFIKEELKSRYNVKGLLEGRIGCAIGAHTGPGILVITFLNETTDKYDESLQ